MERFRLDTTNHSTHSVIPTEAILSVQDYLTQFSLSEKFIERIKIAFGDRFDLAKLEELRQQWVSGQFEALPPIEIRPSAEINGANGAFAAATNTIYLSHDYIAQNASNSQSITDVLLEEIGHFVDAQINTLDSSGDEGAILSALVRGVQSDESELQRLTVENDIATITLDGQIIQIEQATPDPGFTIKFDYKTFGGEFFTDHSERTKALEAAAAFWERSINALGEEFDDVPQGTPVLITNPRTLEPEIIRDAPEIDDILIYVGSNNLSKLGKSVIATGAFAVGLTETPISKRIKNLNNFEPWSGSLIFNSDTDFYVDPTPLNADDDLVELKKTGNQDFVTAAIHEIGHILGIGGSPAFKERAKTGNFTTAVKFFNTFDNNTQSNRDLLPLTDNKNHINGTNQGKVDGRI